MRILTIRRLRFSLRAVLIAVVFVAMASYCLILPSLNARRFVRAVKSDDFAAADKWFIHEKDRFLDAYSKQFWTFNFDASVEPWSLSEFLHGERRISYQLNFGGPRPLVGKGGTIVSNFRGLESLEVTSGGFSGFSM